MIELEVQIMKVMDGIIQNTAFIVVDMVTQLSFSNRNMIILTIISLYLLIIHPIEVLMILNDQSLRHTQVKKILMYWV